MRSREGDRRTTDQRGTEIDGVTVVNEEGAIGGGKMKGEADTAIRADAGVAENEMRKGTTRERVGLPKLVRTKANLGDHNPNRQSVDLDWGKQMKEDSGTGDVNGNSRQE